MESDWNPRFTKQKLAPWGGYRNQIIKIDIRPRRKILEQPFYAHLVLKREAKPTFLGHAKELWLSPSWMILAESPKTPEKLDSQTSNITPLGGNIKPRPVGVNFLRTAAGGGWHQMRDR